ncbi:MAG: hypothetical protein M3Q68_01865 [Actinomycetota bacterium]|nr:hypothetical protein [Actinomycetota bacterium]
MSADADRREEPTVEFVPTWHEEEPTGAFTPTWDDEMAEPGPPPVHDEMGGEMGTGALRPVAPEPAVAVRRNPSTDILPPRARRPSPARRALARARAAVGLVILVVVAGVGLAGAIGAFVLAVAFALQRAAGG